MDLEKLHNCWREGGKGLAGRGKKREWDWHHRFSISRFSILVFEQVIQLFHLKLLLFLPSNILTIFSINCPCLHDRNKPNQFAPSCFLKRQSAKCPLFDQIPSGCLTYIHLHTSFFCCFFFFFILKKGFNNTSSQTPWRLHEVENPR